MDMDLRPCRRRHVPGVLWRAGAPRAFTSRATARMTRDYISRCPHCGQRHSRSTVIMEQGDPAPEPLPEAGDFTICWQCGEFSVFDDAGRMRKAHELREPAAVSATQHARTCASDGKWPRPPATNSRVEIRSRILCRPVFKTNMDARPHSPNRGQRISGEEVRQEREPDAFPIQCSKCV